MSFLVYINIFIQLSMREIEIEFLITLEKVKGNKPLKPASSFSVKSDSPLTEVRPALFLNNKFKKAG